MAYALSGERPAFAVRSLRSFGVMLGWLARAWTVKRRRQSLAALLELDDYRLWDLGVTRHDIAVALRAPDCDIAALRQWRSAADIWPPR